jgi:hypothetical protein
VLTATTVADDDDAGHLHVCHLKNPTTINLVISFLFYQSQLLTSFLLSLIISLICLFL